MLPVAEEVGWTGFAFARLQDRHGPMQNAIVNPTGLVGLVGLPQFEILVIMGGVVVVAAVVIAFTTRSRLGLERPSESARANRPSGP
ncbi:MAG: hypothetical protein ACJ72M_14610 [Propionibacteriaceae bacterium]|jgi:membrane protease YdiL (CAAX protease family)